MKKKEQGVTKSAVQYWDDFLKDATFVYDGDVFIAKRGLQRLRLIIEGKFDLLKEKDNYNRWMEMGESEAFIYQFAAKTRYVTDAKIYVGNIISWGKPLNDILLPNDAYRIIYKMARKAMKMDFEKEQDKQAKLRKSTNMARRRMLIGKNLFSHIPIFGKRQI